MTAEPSGREPTLAERIAYTRAHVAEEWRDAYEGALPEATERALDSGDYGPLVDVVEQWWRAARLEHHGGEGWRRQRRLIERGAAGRQRAGRRGCDGAGVAALSRYRIEQTPELAETVAGLSPQARRWLAGICRTLAAGPLPGQSGLDVLPHPRLPNTYTVGR